MILVEITILDMDTYIKKRIDQQNSSIERKRCFAFRNELLKNRNKVYLIWMI